LYASPNIIRKVKSRRMKLAEHVTCMQEMKNAYKILVGKRAGKRPLGRHGRTCEYNIKLDFREMWGAGDVDWIHLAQDKDQWWTLVNTVMKLRVP
jgi:hypothetical protein